MTYHAQLKELFDAGYRVRVRHERLWLPDPKAVPGKMQSVGAGRTDERAGAVFQAPWVICAKGGRTVVQIMHGDDPTVIAQGISVCSVNDNFVKKVGLNKALGLAVRELWQHRRVARAAR